MRNIFTALLIVLSTALLMAQEEKIYSFHSDISVDSSGMITVREDIRIFAKGDLFKRGITRSLPLTRRDRDGNPVRVGYAVKEVLLDGVAAGFFTDKEGGDLVIYVGEKDRFLHPGYYSYVIVYETAGQVGFFNDYDELSWNVNGVSDKMLDSVSVVVRLPEGAEVLSYRCYTGTQGSAESDCNAESLGTGMVYASAIDLKPYAMLTISAGFTKGAVQPPAVEPARRLGFFDRNGLAVVTVVALLILFTYYIYTWRRYGVDPPKPVVIPQFSPPDGLSPASVGMLYKGRFLDDLVTASIVNLSVKGYIRIEEVIEKGGLFGIRRDRCYSLVKLKDGDNSLAQEEEIVMRDLFKGVDKVYLDGKYDERIAGLMLSFRYSLSNQYSPVLREGRNLKFHLFPWLVMIIYVFTVISFVKDGLIEFQANRIAMQVGLAAMVVAYPVYAWLIIRPGERKLHYQSSIAGLKMYMDVAEEKRLQFFNPPAVTPEVFEQLLPYAIALDMEKVWGEKFEKSFLAAMDRPELYRPAWYSGTFINAAMFGHVLNSTLSNTVIHAATPPQIAAAGGGGSWGSGSFGGGFSGMGGGGGHVGGW